MMKQRNLKRWLCALGVAATMPLTAYAEASENSPTSPGSCHPCHSGAEKEEEVKRGHREKLR